MRFYQKNELRWAEDIAWLGDLPRWLRHLILATLFVALVLPLIAASAWIAVKALWGAIGDMASEFDKERG
jgi:hypothetical protein